MQFEIHSGYRAMDDELNILVAPVGCAWLKALEKDKLSCLSEQSFSTS
jgi:hypothetical protein